MADAQLCSILLLERKACLCPHFLLTFSVCCPLPVPLFAQRLRQRQMRNFATAVLLAQGVPMLTMGDEYGLSKRGNNNTYCHDGPLNWFDWGMASNDPSGLLRFVKGLIKLR